MTISTCFNPAINPREILGRIKELLNRVNPQFSEEEKKYTKATKKLRKAVSNTIPSVEEYLATLEESYGYELLYICWQGFQYNLHSPTTIVAAFTTEIKKIYQPTHVVVGPSSGLPKQSMLMLEHLFTIDKHTVLSYVGTASEEFIDKVDKALAVSIGIHPTICNSKSMAKGLLQGAKEKT